MAGRVGERGGRGREVTFGGPQPHASRRRQRPREPGPAHRRRRVPRLVRARQVTHQADHAQPPLALVPPRGDAQERPLGRSSAVPCQPGVQVQVHARARRGAGDRLQVRHRRDGDVHPGLHGARPVRVDRVEPAEHGCRQTFRPQGERLVEAGHPQPRGPRREGGAGHVGGPEAEPVRLDDGHQAARRAAGEQPGVVRDGLEVHDQSGSRGRRPPRGGPRVGERVVMAPQWRPSPRRRLHLRCRGLARRYRTADRPD